MQRASATSDKRWKPLVETFGLETLSRETCSDTFQTDRMCRRVIHCRVHTHHARARLYAPQLPPQVLTVGPQRQFASIGAALAAAPTAVFVRIEPGTCVPA